MLQSLSRAIIPLQQRDLVENMTIQFGTFWNKLVSKEIQMPLQAKERMNKDLLSSMMGVVAPIITFKKRNKPGS